MSHNKINDNKANGSLELETWNATQRIQIINNMHTRVCFTVNLPPPSKDLNPTVHGNCLVKVFSCALFVRRMSASGVMLVIFQLPI